jgi:hypothetical protein|tara:strand:+ start:567 stop:863 length:297 start_codon:yes stop_codon:yes gene_type:complete
MCSADIDKLKFNIMTDKQKILQIEISNIVDKMTNGLMHPITGKQMLYESSIKALTIPVVSQQRELLNFLKWYDDDLEYNSKQTHEQLILSYVQKFNCG